MFCDVLVSNSNVKTLTIVEPALLWSADSFSQEIRQVGPGGSDELVGSASPSSPAIVTSRQENPVQNITKMASLFVAKLNIFKLFSLLISASNGFVFEYK